MKIYPQFAIIISMSQLKPKCLEQSFLRALEFNNNDLQFEYRLWAQLDRSIFL